MPLKKKQININWRCSNNSTDSTGYKGQCRDDDGMGMKCKIEDHDDDYMMMTALQLVLDCV